MSAPFSSHRPIIEGTHWIITADHPLAAQAGAAVLESGGNAIDAAVAANLVLTVVRPHMCGIGGDLFALVFMRSNHSFEALNASGRAPAAANLEFYRKHGHTTMPETGILTATVPGAIAGWQAMLEKYGTMGLDRLLSKAIDYAQNGFPLYKELRNDIVGCQKFLLKSPAMSETFLKNGAIPNTGELIFQHRLANAYRIIADRGPDAFYRGPLGEALIDYSKSTGGLFDPQDLSDHTITWQTPLKTTYRDYEICTQPPNSQGIALLMQANMLENIDLSGFSIGHPDLVHFMVEAKKLAFADRDRYVCDPDFAPIPTGKMLDRQYAKKQFRRIDPGSASDSIEATDFTGGDDTVYLAVVDRYGNAVSLIQSIFKAFGSCVMVPETGMILHNRGRGFSLDPNHANCLEPGKRPYHTLHPAMILKNGRPYVVLGSPGADGQTQTVSQLIAALIDFGADVQQAMEAPRWRSEPDGTLLMESRFSPETISDLEKKGHRIDLLSGWSPIMGSSQAILIEAEAGFLAGGADPRRQAYVIGS